MTAILFGSISTLADTSELQRGSFNDAFREHGLDWNWEREEYQSLLDSNGGRQRVADEATRRGVEVDATAIHASKSRRFLEMLEGVRLTARPGVADTIRDAKARGWRVGLVTTTSADNVDAIFRSTGEAITRDDFDVVIDSDQVDAPKPDPAAYLKALEALGEDAARCVAIEDNVGGVKSASDAGIPCVAFPNENTVTHDFGSTPVVHSLGFDELAGLASADAR